MGCGCQGKVSRTPTDFKTSRSRYALVDRNTHPDPASIPASMKFDSGVAASRALANYPNKTIIMIKE